MNLQEMKKSCEEFAKDLKTGNIEWEIDTDFEHGFRTKISNIHTFVFLVFDRGSNYQKPKHYFELVSVFFSGLTLQSTTAKEAAHEALQLVKTEAEKLLNALSEPKEPFWIPIDGNNMPNRKVVGAYFGNDKRINYGIRSFGFCKKDTFSDRFKINGEFATHFHHISRYPQPKL